MKQSYIYLHTDNISLLSKMGKGMFCLFTDSNTSQKIRWRQVHLNKHYLFHRPLTWHTVYRGPFRLFIYSRGQFHKPQMLAFKHQLPVFKLQGLLFPISLNYLGFKCLKAVYLFNVMLSQRCIVCK